MSTNTQDYFTTLTQQGQDASRAALEAWTRALQTTTVRLPSVTTLAATHELIDQVSDLAVSLVNVQRSLAKQFTESAVTATEGFVQQASERLEQAGEDVARIGESVE